jgi:hypothetical protein
MNQALCFGNAYAIAESLLAESHHPFAVEKPKHAGAR